MVFGRLIRSLSLRLQASEQEPQSSCSSVQPEDSITNDAVSQSVQVFSCMMLLQFRAVVDEQGTDEAGQALVYKAEQQSCQPASELDQTCLSKSARSIDSPQARLQGLTPTEGSWVAAMQCKRSAADVGSDDATVKDNATVNRKACAILNKLTVEKFDSLFEQLATCGIRESEHLEMLMREVFNKATTQHHFIAMYAELCVRLEQDSRISSVVEAAGQQHSFRRLLLNQCQISFERLLEPTDLQQASKVAGMDEEIAVKRKQQALGNIKLIGHLLVHGLVSSKLLVECSEELLRCRNTCPEALESLAALLTVAGKQFDSGTWQYHPQLVEVFTFMRKLSKDKAMPARARFLLRDVLDFRDAGWSHCTYQATLATTPMKLDEVRESAAHEGKYMSLDDQVETDSLLAGLMRISKTANANKDKYRVGNDSSQQGSSTQPKAFRQKPSRSLVSSSKCVASPLPAPPLVEGGLKPWMKDPASKRPACSKDEEGSALGAGKFDAVSFHHALATILGDLASDRNVPAAVRRIRLQEVPHEYQANEFADIISRIVEEKRGPIRRCALSFAAALAAAEQSAFDRTACLDGISQFFKEVYPALCSEIPRLPAITTSELLPTLRNVFSSAELNQRLPSFLVSPCA